MARNNKSPLKFFPAVAAALGISTGALGVGIIGGGLLAARGIGKGIRGARRRDRANQAELAQYKKEFDKRIEDYEKSQFQPLDADALKQENIFEDITVDTEAADYARQQFAQQQANIMTGLRGIAGSSGIAGLAQSLSNQAAQQAKETRLTIGQQLQQNRRMQMQEQSRLNQQQRQIQIANMEGARQFELDKMTTLIGVAGQKISGTQGAISQRQQLYGQITGGVRQIAAAAIGKIPTG